MIEKSGRERIFQQKIEDYKNKENGHSGAVKHHN